MNQKYILISSILLGLTFSVHSMNEMYEIDFETFGESEESTESDENNKNVTIIDPIQSLGPISCKLIKAYEKKMGTETIIQQLKQSRPDRDVIDPSPSFICHQVRIIDRIPALKFKLYFMKNIEKVRREDKLFNDDPTLNNIVFSAIQKIENKKEYVPEGYKTQTNNGNVIQHTATNEIEDNIRYYWYQKDDPQRASVECRCMFRHEDKNAIKQLIKTNENNTNK